MSSLKSSEKAAMGNMNKSNLYGEELHDESRSSHSEEGQPT